MRESPLLSAQSPETGARDKRTVFCVTVASFPMSKEAMSKVGKKVTI